MSLLEKIEKVDSRYIWLILLALYAIPVIQPIGIPLPISQQTKTFYDRIMRLKSGDIVMWEISSRLAMISEQEPGVTAVSKHLFSRKIKVAYFCFETEGPVFLELIMRGVSPETRFGAKYGEDYVNLGYVAGGETAMVSMMSDVWKTTPTDYFKNRMESLPMMAKLHSASDAALLLASYGDVPDMRIRSYSVKAGLTGDRAWVAVVGGSHGPALIPYIASKDVAAMLAGAVPGAEYEKLIGFPGKGLVYTDIISMAHICLVGAIVVANVTFLGLRRKGGTGK